MHDKHRKRLFIIDGNSFCYRAYYAIRYLANSKGQPTNAIYGVISMIKKIINEESPNMIAVAFDLKAPTFRHKQYKEYKITRKPMPNDLVSQMEYIKKVIRAYNIPIYEQEGYEADDILATLTKKAEDMEIDTFIVTGDKDAMQLIGPHVMVYSPHKEGTVYGSNEVRRRYGVGPEKMTDLMGLMGDASDNIPGIPGIGEKTAIELMRQFSSLEDLLNNIDKIKHESWRKKIEQSRELAIMSKELATIRKDVPIDVKFEDLVLRSPDEEELAVLFRELEFRNLLKDIAPKIKHEGEYRLIDCKKDFQDLLHEFEAISEYAFDFEATHYDPMKAVPVGISFSWKEGHAAYIPFNALKDMSSEQVLEKLKPIFEDKDVKKIGQNIKYDILIMRKLGIKVAGVSFDTMVASYLLNPSRSMHNLNDIALEHLGRSIGSIEELIGKGKKAITMDKVDVAKVCDYCSRDSDVAYSVAKVLEKKLREKELYDLFRDVEMPLVCVLARMESWGVSIDVEYLHLLSVQMEEKMSRLEKKIHLLAEEKFNIRSSKQLQVILFDKLKMPVIKRTKTGASTDEEVLRTLSKNNDLPKEILAYRELAKLRSTYVDNLPGLINARTGRLHTSFNQAVTATGRLSSSEPNLQNIPIRTELGRQIRRAFIAKKKSHVLISADYSQIELRILAHLSRDINLTNAFKKERDIHTFTASLIYGSNEDVITPRMRQTAKTVNFGIVYGMSAYGLGRDLGIDVREAAKFIEAYFERYPDIKSYLESQVKMAREQGYVKTILGRRRYIPEINSSNVSVRNFAERTAVNAPIQGSAADLIKLAMIDIDRHLDKFNAKMILQVHDELVFEIENSSVSEFAKQIREAMEGVMELSVPIRVDIESGVNWLEMKEVEGCW